MSRISIFKYKTKQIINLLLLNNFYSVISYRRVEKDSDELLYTVWSLVMVRANQLPAQEVNSENRNAIVSCNAKEYISVFLFLIYVRSFLTIFHRKKLTLLESTVLLVVGGLLLLSKNGKKLNTKMKWAKRWLIQRNRFSL